ncbi:carbohydrate ABC transporter permease [Cohnella silvisoli]|uniref:Sugar ABC transporter permease n=1 Tax=Cohnella silvisoli TaxID=2873699 RepID=A0ABV1L0G4_9BACL|nr:sugar ABC transporter permease [Cohnella silvisoli]MCD9025137.1 sugar ABC transporter permease [Cohnella silvisoli]
MKSRKERFKSQLISFSFLLPYLIVAVVFSFLPIAVVVWLSFQRGSLLDLSSLHGAGFANFAAVFTKSLYMKSILNSLFYIVVILPFGQFIALTLAFLLFRKNKVNAVFESILFLPLVVSMVSASIMISYVLSTNGPVNYLLAEVGLPGILWFSDPVLAKLAVVILELWKGSMFYVFIYMAALRGVPSDYIDAARIDGAAKWQEIVLIKLPLIKHIILLCVVLSTIAQSQMFDSIFVLTKGGPLRSSESIYFAIYRAAFLDDQIGISAAIAILLMLAVLAISIFQMTVLRSRHES